MTIDMTRCQQCWDHRCIPKNCKCDCHEEYTNKMRKLKLDEKLKGRKILKRHEEKED